MKLISLNCRVWTRGTDRSSDKYWKKRMKAPCMIVGDFNHSYIDVGANLRINL